MIEKARAELGAQIFQRKGAEDAFNDAYIQVRKICIASSGKLQISSATQGKDLEIRKVEVFVKKQTIIYMKEHAIHSDDFALKQNDLSVFQFIMEQTNCRKHSCSMMLAPQNRTPNC